MNFTKEMSTAIFCQIFVAFLENLNCRPNQDKTRQNLYKLNVPLPISHTYTKKQVECRVENTTIDSILYEGFERPWDRARFDDWWFMSSSLARNGSSFFSEPRLCVLTASPGSAQPAWPYWQDFIEDCVLYLGTSWIPLHPFCPVFSALFSHVSLSCDYLVTTHVYVLERMWNTRFLGWAFLQNINGFGKVWRMDGSNSIHFPYYFMVK